MKLENESRDNSESMYKQHKRMDLFGNIPILSFLRNTLNLILKYSHILGAFSKICRIGFSNTLKSVKNNCHYGNF